MSITPEIVAKQIVKLLPPDGAPVLNRLLRMMAGRELEAEVPEEVFIAARDQLLAGGRVGRLRGQGGQTFLLSRDAAPLPTPQTVSETLSEAKLMEPLGTYLRGPFVRGLELPKDGHWIVQDTSRIGPPLARWARPDFIVVSVTSFRFLPGRHVDVYSFELKTEKGATDLAVYEALAQTRFTHFGYLVWHLPDGSKHENRLNEIEQQCSTHGVGLIRMVKPDEPESYRILLDPVRKPTMSADVDDFLASRLSPEHKVNLIGWIEGFGT